MVKDVKQGNQIFCITLGRYFKNINTAARELNLAYYDIKLVCDGKLASLNGLRFKYEGNTHIKRINKYPDKPVYCVDLKKKYPSVASAARALNLAQSEVSRVCRGKGKTAGGHQFVFEEDRVRPSNKPKPVYCVDLKIIYPSAGAAARALGILQSNILSVCRGEGKTAGGHQFVFEGDPVRPLRYMYPKAVYCVDLKILYPSAAAAARALGISQSNISYVCCGKGKTAGGHWFVYEGDPIPNMELHEYEKPVYCIDLKKSYVTAAAAAKDLNINQYSILRVCNKLAFTCGGFRFVFKGDAEYIPEYKYKMVGKPVFCLSNRKTYKNATQAAKSLGIGLTCILKVCRGEQDVTYGYKFRYKKGK